MAPGISIGGEFFTQWRNPSDTLTILMIIGGEIVQTALAQMTGSAIAPVAFSFGWVAYSFKTLVSLLGDGRLMPAPDYPCKLINAENGYVRDNKSWMLSRLLRDDVPPLAGEGLVVSVYRAREGKPHGTPQRGSLEFLSGATIVLQLVLAALPWILRGEQDVFVVAAWGSVLAFATGCLPQWRVEQYPCRDIAKEKKPYRKDVILTQGNGSRYAMLIISDRCGLDMEDLAAGEGPRVARPWERKGVFVKRERDKGKSAKKADGDEEKADDGKQNPQNTTPETLRTINWRKLPLDFWLTRLLCLVLAVGWIALLITVAGLRQNQNSWFLLLVGAVGMAQNAVVAGATRTPEKKGVYLEKEDEIRACKVMDALMDLEWSYPGAGYHMLSEFFPAGVKENHFEPEWWAGDTKRYDEIRHLPKNSWRGEARSTKYKETQPGLKFWKYEPNRNVFDKQPRQDTLPATSTQAPAETKETSTT